MGVYEGCCGLNWESGRAGGAGCGVDMEDMFCGVPPRLASWLPGFGGGGGGVLGSMEGFIICGAE